ncbi:molybdopterin-binding protein, partial [Rhizobium sp. SEMIA 4085]|uniref:competence/damage-inducible protein A n=1 Tax=Rhizobium sp. SEMIA 4085 TaxID=2137761 RepID=UPI001FEFE6E8
MSTDTVITAAMVAIGDELLSGRTKDKNIGHLADMLQLSGIDLKEVRIVADDEDAIVEALNALRGKYDYVFTSGGIGPTHDDITADAVSKAFGVRCDYDAAAMTLLGDMYKRREMEFTEARKRMARMPRGAAHIANPVSTAPGFIIGNVYVMAGVPQVFQAMVDNVLPTLRTGQRGRAPALACPHAGSAIGPTARAPPQGRPGTPPRPQPPP